MSYLNQILQKYGIEPPFSIKSFGNGLINNTWLVTNNKKEFILQKINKWVFNAPADIDYNINLIQTSLKLNKTKCTIVPLIPTVSGKTIICFRNEYYRLSKFIKDSHTIDVVENSNQAFEAAKQFGLFTSSLKFLNTGKLKITIPHFHDLEWRYKEYLTILKRGNEKRIAESFSVINKMNKFSFILKEFIMLKSNPGFKLRVMHHDTKISNVLFDKSDKGICVIDLDTVMPGYFISDIGDMMRTYLSPVNEEEKDYSKIIIRKEIYSAIVDGYLFHMDNELSKVEKSYIIFGGKFMIYMQALRFLTDHLNNDLYYGSGYEGHNLCRAENQLTLLKKLCLFEKEIQ